MGEGAVAEHSTRQRRLGQSGKAQHQEETLRDLRGKRGGTVSEAAGHRYQRDSWSAQVHEATIYIEKVGTV